MDLKQKNDAQIKRKRKHKVKTDLPIENIIINEALGKSDCT
jgi:hypothetical protein